MSTIILELPEELAAVVRTPQGMEKAQAIIVEAFSKEAERQVRRREEVQRSAKAIAALFAEWAEEDAAMTPEEREQASREAEEFQRNMNANRAATGEEPLY